MNDDEVIDEASRIEAAEAGIHAEHSENDTDRHVTATDVAGYHPHHHPADPNRGVVRMRLGAGAIVGGLLATVVTIGGLIALALAIGSH